MKKKTAIWSAVTAFILVFFMFAEISGAQSAPKEQPPQPRGGAFKFPDQAWNMGAGYGMRSFWREISPEKREQIAAIWSDAEKSLFELHQQLYTKEAALNAILADPNSNDSQLAAAIKEVSEVDAKIFETRVNVRRKITKETGIIFPFSMSKGCFGVGMQPGTGMPNMMAPNPGMGKFGR